MLKVTIFPNLIISPEQHANPYIQDFIGAINALPDVQVVNPPHKNPLLSLLPRRHWGDVFIFNWFESLPEFKYGLLQSLIGVCFVSILRLSGRKVVWVLHNKENHTGRHNRLTHWLRRFIARRSSLIITHATDGVRLVEKQYPFASHKTRFLHHPTKDRLALSPPQTEKIIYDILIWGHISRYKGVLDFVKFLNAGHIEDIRVCIAGKCNTPELREELVGQLPANVTYIDKSLSFEELGGYVAKSRFVLTPYSPESILSSGALMDSLSFGAGVIGPNVGSFSDYAREPLLSVYTFERFEDIPRIIRDHRDTPADRDGYSRFLHEHDWSHFAGRLLELIKNQI